MKGKPWVHDRVGVLGGLLALSLMACSLVTNSLAGPSTLAPQSTSGPEPSGTEAAASLHDLVPAKVNGTELEFQQIEGARVAAGGDTNNASDQSARGTLAHASLALAVAPADADFTFRAGLLTLPGDDWGAALRTYRAEAGAGMKFADVKLRGSPALQVSSPSGDAPPVFYQAQGSSLFFFQATDPSVVDPSLSGARPGPRLAGTGGVRARPATQSGALMVLSLVEQPLPPVCVGEPVGRQRLTAMAFDAGTLIPLPDAIFTATPIAGSLQPSAPVAGPMVIYQYEADRYVSGPGESFNLEARSYTGAYGLFPVAFPVQHCLQGTWQDGPRVVRITPPDSSDIVAVITEGTLECGETGNDFTGHLDGDRMTGSDLLVCNPKPCVDAGLMPKTDTTPFEGQVAMDGQSLQIDWTRQLFDVNQSNGKVTACTPSTTEQQSFTMQRLSYSP